MIELLESSEECMNRESCEGCAGVKYPEMCLYHGKRINQGVKA